MKQDLQLKLQAYLDGELPAGEVKAVTAWLSQDTEARALLAELTHTHNALSGFETEIRVPETREFYWSKVARDIQRQEVSGHQRRQFPLFTLLRRLAVPASAGLMLLVGVVGVRRQMGVDSNFAVVENDTAQADAGTFTYRDFASGTTLVWLSYPVENEFAEPAFPDTISWE